MDCAVALPSRDGFGVLAVALGPCFRVRSTDQFRDFQAVLAGQPRGVPHCPNRGDVVLVGGAVVKVFVRRFEREADGGGSGGAHEGILSERGAGVKFPPPMGFSGAGR